MGRHRGLRGRGADDATGPEQREARRTRALLHLAPAPAALLRYRGPEATVVLDANPALADLLGRDLTGTTGPGLAAVVAPDDLDAVWSLLAGPTPSPEARRIEQEIRVLAADGRCLSVVATATLTGDPWPDGTLELLLQLEDVTVQRQAQRALSEMALTDALTGLPNRYALGDRIAAALQRLQRNPGLVCLLFCDLDQFKQINDGRGHQAGDDLLRVVADRLRESVRHDDTVARLGGDEFVIVFEGLSTPAEAMMMAMRLQDGVRRPWTHGSVEFTPTMSIGVSWTDDPHTPIDDLLRRGDQAMYRAKNAGRDHVELYDRSFDQELAHTVAMQHRMRTALVRGTLVLHYQPVVRLADGTVTGVEALARLPRSDGSLIAPLDFLPHAEASGLIAPLGRWVMRQALVDTGAWRRAGQPYLVGINVSPTQLRRHEFPDQLLAEAARADVPPHAVCVEVTEAVLAAENRFVADALARLHGAGVRIALDDFGSGASSLRWLTDAPVDVVKIGRGLTAALLADGRRRATAAAIVHLAADLGHDVVAVGVETAEQRDALVAMGCPQAQGFLLGRPVPADDPSWADRPLPARSPDPRT